MRYKLWKKALGFVIGVTVLMAFVGMAQAGSLEPSAAPGPTMKTLDEIPPTWSQILPASERFKLVMGGAAVLDKETGLVWEKAPWTGTQTWLIANSYCYEKNVGGRRGWRLPTIEELASLTDPSVVSTPKLPSGHPFTNVQSSVYWSATTVHGNTSQARVMFFDNSYPGGDWKTSYWYTWCVRGGQGYDAY